MNCKLQNKSGLYLGYFDFFSKSVSRLEFKKSLYLGYFDFSSELVSKVEFKKFTIQVQVISNSK